MIPPSGPCRSILTTQRWTDRFGEQNGDIIMTVTRAIIYTH